MNCCGKKSDVKKPTTVNTSHHHHHTTNVKATKFFNVENNPEINLNTKGFLPIPQTQVNSYSKVTKPENYTYEYSGGSQSRLFGKVTQLNFVFDQDPGVSNTFDVPTFDYQTMLTHNIYYSLNRKAPFKVDDGNVSKFIADGTRNKAL